MGWIREIDRWFIDRVHVHNQSHRKYARHLLRNEEDAEEVVQEAYARLMALKDWQRIADPNAFTIRTIRNLAIERFRRADVVRIDRAVILHRIDAEDTQPRPDQVAIARSELRQVSSVMEKLPHRCREALHLRRIEGLPPARVAENMGIAVSTVEKHLVKGLRLLHEALKFQDYSEDEVRPDALWDPKKREGN